MVFTSVVNFIRSRGPDEFWRKRQIFKLAAHYVGRRRNCYSIAIKNVHRALVYSTKGRKLKKLDMADLWDCRARAGCQEHGIDYFTFRESLARENILLNRKALSELACWEPYTFQSLTEIAKQRAEKDGLNCLNRIENKDRIVSRMLKNKK